MTRWVPNVYVISSCSAMRCSLGKWTSLDSSQGCENGEGLKSEHPLEFGSDRDHKTRTGLGVYHLVGSRYIGLLGGIPSYAELKRFYQLA